MEDFVFYGLLGFHEGIIPIIHEYSVFDLVFLGLTSIKFEK